MFQTVKISNIKIQKEKELCVNEKKIPRFASE